MKNYNQVAIVAISATTESVDGRFGPDKNGKSPVWVAPLNCETGAFPNKLMTLSGTVAEKLGLIVGKTYAVAITEGKASEEFGRNFNMVVLGTLNTKEYLDTKVGMPLAVPYNTDTDQPSGVNSYELKASAKTV